MDDRLKRFIIFVIALIVIILFIGLIINSNKSNTKVSKGTAIYNYTPYNIGDEVTLINNTEWYVLYKSNNNDNYVYLFSKYKVNDEVVDDYYKYINGTYYDKLVNSLYISREQIEVIRLLDKEDICNVLGITGDDFNYKFDISEYSMFSNNTVLNVDGYGQKSFCGEGICDSNTDDIRVVIKINKYFIKE